MRSSRALFSHVRPHLRTLVAGAVLTFLGGATTLAAPLAAKRLLDALAAGQPLATPLVLLTAILLAGAAIGVLGTYLLELAAEQVVLTARRRLVHRLLRLRVAAFDRAEPGDLMSRVTADTTQLRAAATSNVVDLVAGVLQAAGVVVLMAYLDSVLLAVVLGVLAVLGAVIAALTPSVRRSGELAQEAVGGMGAALERALGAFRTVKANGAEEREAATVLAAAQRAQARGLQAARWASAAAICTGVAVQLAFIAVLGVGGARVARGELAVSSLIAFLLYLFYLSGPAAQVIGGVTGLQAGLAAVRRMAEVHRLPAEPAGPPATAASRDAVTAGSPATAGGTPRDAVSVAFHDVRMRHRPDGPDVLCGLRLHVPAGGLTAVVGPSGAGKTTLLSLIERFYDLGAGRVEVAGRDIRDWPLAELRALIGYVEQDTPVLSGTLHDNLTMGDPAIGAGWLAEVLERLCLTALVERLPRGLLTPVGHRGSALSGGERQRVALARALLRRPGLLLLDEPTSQLDAVTEEAIRTTIQEVSRTATVLMVAHRLSTAVTADRIVVLDAGRVRAVGTHEHLLGADDLYRALTGTQLPVTAPAGARRWGGAEISTRYRRPGHRQPDGTSYRKD